jgi:formate-dependent nitrite reductase membrane component NrfD
MNRRRAEVVPEADFRSYYGRPVLKQPTWKVPDVPLYLFLGGMAGSSAMLGVFGQCTGRPGLVRTGRVVSSGAALASVGWLIHDLGRPLRFLNMMRMIKLTSPLSVGSWLLAPFSSLASAAAASELTGLLPTLGTASAAGSAVLGPALCTYTAVLLSDTAIPAWHEPFRQLPFLFGGSALTSGAGAALIAAPLAEQGPARRMGTIGTAVEVAAELHIERRLGLVGEPYQTGRSGRLMRAGRALSAAAAGLSWLGRRSRTVSALAGAAYLAGGLCTRFGVFEAGKVSAADPRYVVVPQRQRVANGGAAALSAANTVQYGQ